MGLQDLIDKLEDVYSKAIGRSISFARGIKETYEVIQKSELAESGKLEVLSSTIGDFLKDMDSEEELIQTLRLLYRFKV